VIDKIKNIFSIPELRFRILFTLGILIIVRVGAHIPIPGVDGEALTGAFSNFQNSLFGLFNTFVGGAFQKASLFFSWYHALHIFIHYHSVNGFCSSLFSETSKRG